MSKSTNQISSLGRATAVKTFTRALLSLPALFLASLAFTATPTLAANTTHPLLSTCTGSGTPTHGFVLPRGVAVNEENGEVFVADRRGGDPAGVDRFSFPGGACSFVEQIDGAAEGGSTGEGVAFDRALRRLFVADSNGGAVDVFEVGTGEHYLFSITGVGAPGGVAVDEATGVLYVSSKEGHVVDEFSAGASGEKKGEFSTEPYGESFEGLAVNTAGDVFVTLKKQIPEGAVKVIEVVEFDKAGKFVRTLGGPGAVGVAVDPHEGDVFVAYPKFVEEFASEGILEGARVSRFGGPNLAQAAGVAVDGATGDVYVTDEGEESQGKVVVPASLHVFGPSAPAPSVSTGEASVSATEVKLSGVVNPETENLSLPASYRFEYATEAEYLAGCKESGSVLRPEVEWEASCARFTHSVPASAVSVGTGTTGVPVSTPLPLSGLEKGTPYRYRIVGYNANADGSNGRVEGETKSFFTPGPPVIEEQWASEVGPDSAVLNAKIAPGNLATKYRLEYGSTEAYGHESAELSLPAGTAPVTVSVPLSELPENTAFHVRFVAENELSKLEVNPAIGGDVPFVTFSSLTGLPDGRGFELVTPVDNHDAQVYSPVNELQGSSEYGEYSPLPFQASVDGGGMTYAGSATPEGNGEEGNGSGNQYLARRTGSGWVQSAISPRGHNSAAYEEFSSDLGMSVFRSGGSESGQAGGSETAPLLPEVEIPATEPVLYLRNDETGAERALFTHFDEPDPEGLVDELAGASEDFETLIFEASAALTQGAPPSGHGVNDLYEWVGGSLSLVNVLPEGKGPEPDALFGGPYSGGGSSSGNGKLEAHGGDISRDGSRVFWTGLNSHGLYLSEAGGEAVQIDVPNENCGKGCKAGEGEFLTATPDGEQAFFLDVNDLTKDATAAVGEPDLYEYDASRPEGERLLDLSVATGGAHANVQGVLGTSENASYVYFAATGVLADNENGNSEKAQAGKANLYEWHEGRVRFVAPLTGYDGLSIEHASSAGTGGDWTRSLSDRTSEVTPGGEDLLFMATEKLTGYENEGFSEVYVYDGATGVMSCASCNPSGERLRPSPAFFGGTSLVPAGGNPLRTQQWMSDDGDRVFFDSAASLVPQDTNGLVDVYEWERDGTGECDRPTGCVYLLSGGKSDDNSYFLDATPDGNEVFIATRAQLVPEDENESFDLYDVRVGAKGPVSAPACTGTGCQGVPAAPPIFATPSSITAEGLGDFPAPSPLVVKPKTKTGKCKKADVKKHNKCVRKKKANTKKSAHTNRRARR